MEIFMCRKASVSLLVVLILTINASAISKGASNENLGFIASLQAQEDADYQALTDSIKRMSDSEYKAFLNQRIEQDFDDDKEKAVLLIVDVTEEMNQPEPGFFKKLFSPKTDEKALGRLKTENILKQFQVKNRAPVKYKSSFKGKGNDLFQRVDTVVDQKSAYLLVSHNEIRDIHIIDSLDPANSFTTLHTPTGRVIPRQVQKVYDQKFIDDGLYAELLQKFENNRTLSVQVSFPKPDGYENTREFNEQARTLVSEFVGSWEGYSFEVLYKAEFYVFMQTTKEHVLAMKQDERVLSISAGSPF